MNVLAAAEKRVLRSQKSLNAMEDDNLAKSGLSIYDTEGDLDKMHKFTVKKRGVGFVDNKDKFGKELRIRMVNMMKHFNYQ